jgi:tripartite-type tricarboxylate transporter receptor subunit TctC
MQCVRIIWLAFLATVGAASGAAAQTGSNALSADYPNQTVRIVVPVTAGSTADILARALADRLAPAWSQSVIVENRPGIAGISSVAKAAADGHTLMLTANGHAAVATLNKGLSFDPVSDLVGVAQIAVIPLVLVVPLTLPVTTLDDVVTLARARPGALNFASAGLGSTSHLAGEVFRRAANIDVRHVPYRGAESLTSIVRGDTEMTFVPVPIALELIHTGKLRPITVVSRSRIPELPDVLTVEEAGFPDFTYNAWFGVFAPVKAPRSVIDKIGQDTRQILEIPEINTRLSQQGVEVVFSATDQFDALVKADAARYARLLSDPGDNRR